MVVVREMGKGIGKGNGKRWEKAGKRMGSRIQEVKEGERLDAGASGRREFVLG